MSLDFTPPNKNPNFVRYWEKFLPAIQGRDNLKESHLHQLRILCDLSVEYDLITEILNEEGMTFMSQGRNGSQIHIRPEVQQKNRVVTEIRNYSKMLDLVLYKDKETTKEKEENEFDS